MLLIGSMQNSYFEVQGYTVILIVAVAVQIQIQLATVTKAQVTAIAAPKHPLGQLQLRGCHASHTIEFSRSAQGANAINIIT